MFHFLDSHNRYAGGQAHLQSLVRIGCAAVFLLLYSCSAGTGALQTDQDTEKQSPGVPYSIVCIIHGDGGYLYHDTSGKARKADEMALAEITKVAELNPLAEVLIFHQKSKRNFLFLFPLRDGDFYYYRNGRLIAKDSYWRGYKQTRFAPEVDLYRRFHTESALPQTRLFVYFGHEIPEFGGAGYDLSSPDQEFTIHDLTQGLQGLTHGSKRFDLMLLSTCYGGTPYTINALTPFTRSIVASPDNLHLSYFDLAPLNRLDSTFQDGDVSSFAAKFARATFDKLAPDIQTALSVAVYDTDRTQEYLRGVRYAYDEVLSSLKGKSQAAMASVEHCDCAEITAFKLPSINNGVDVFYKPARFGRAKEKQSHSGWECWRERVARNAALPPTPDSK